MPKKDTQLTKQVGEYLVAAELARRGLISATFAGSVRHFDIVASGPSGGHLPIQVKAMATGNWQLDIKDFAEVSFRGHEQVLGGPKAAPYDRLVFVFVAVDAYGSDQFFIIDWVALCDLLIPEYEAYLSIHQGVRPRNWETTHTAISIAQLSPFKDRWETITARVSHAA